MKTLIELRRTGARRVYHRTGLYAWTHPDTVGWRRTCTACTTGTIPSNITHLKADNQ